MANCSGQMPPSLARASTTWRTRTGGSRKWRGCCPKWGASASSSLPRHPSPTSSSCYGQVSCISTNGKSNYVCKTVKITSFPPPTLILLQNDVPNLFRLLPTQSVCVISAFSLKQPNLCCSVTLDFLLFGDTATAVSKWTNVPAMMLPDKRLHQETLARKSQKILRQPTDKQTTHPARANLWNLADMRKILWMQIKRATDDCDTRLQLFRSSRQIKHAFPSELYSDDETTTTTQFDE